MVPRGKVNYTGPRGMRRRTDPRTGLLIAFILGAIFLHVVVLAGGSALIQHFGGFGLFNPDERDKPDKEVELELKKERFQVVEIPRPEKERVPDKTRFVSEFNSRVKKQTQARHRGLRPRVAMRQRQDGAEREVEPGQQSAALRPQLEKLRRRVASHRLLAMRSQRKVSPRQDRRQGRRSRSVLKKRLRLRDLRPSRGALLKAIPGAFPDYLKDIDKGEQTLLNTKEWRFASFFNRVKRAVAQHWHPAREYRRRDPRGNVYGFKTRLTVLHILLRPDGTLKKIILERPCGLGFLDEEAVRAFRKAAPFPNPPRRLVNPRTKQIAFRFGFIFEISRSPSWRIFRFK